MQGLVPLMIFEGSVGTWSRQGTFRLVATNQDLSLLRRRPQCLASRSSLREKHFCKRNYSTKWYWLTFAESREDYNSQNASSKDFHVSIQNVNVQNLSEISSFYNAPKRCKFWLSFENSDYSNSRKLLNPHLIYVLCFRFIQLICKFWGNLKLLINCYIY